MQKDREMSFENQFLSPYLDAVHLFQRIMAARVVRRKGWARLAGYVMADQSGLAATALLLSVSGSAFRALRGNWQGVKAGHVLQRGWRALHV